MKLIARTMDVIGGSAMNSAPEAMGLAWFAV